MAEPARMMMGIASRAQPQFSDTTTTELLLITIALVTSTALTVIPSSRSTVRTTAEPHPVILNHISVFCMAVAFVVSAVALFLGWFREISLDALATVIFALIPAVFSMQSSVVMEEIMHWRMRMRRSLGIKHDFRYVRVGDACKAGEKGHLWKYSFNGECRRSQCDVHIFIRYQAHICRAWLPRWCSLNHSKFKAEREMNRQRKVATGDTLQHEQLEPTPNLTEQWWGIRIHHSTCALILRDKQDGLKFWWWSAVSSATWLVASPGIVRVTSREQMMNALVLLADIISIGDLVLSFHGEFIKHQITRNRGVQKAVTATPGVLCNLIMKELGFLEWGQIGNELLADNFVYPRESMQEYSILFFILTEKSAMYKSKERTTRDTAERAWTRRMSAQDILDKLEDPPKEVGVDCDDFARELSRQWLEDWGCKKSLDGFYTARAVGDP